MWTESGWDVGQNMLTATLGLVFKATRSVHVQRSFVAQIKNMALPGKVAAAHSPLPWQLPAIRCEELAL